WSQTMLRISLVACAVLSTLASVADAEPRTYGVDSTHTSVKFEVKFLGLVHVEGRFGRAGGDLRWDPQDLAHSSVQFAIDAASLDTGIPARDKHLCSADFFAVDSFPQVTFHSDRIERAGEGYVATGPFTLHGVS